MIPSQNTHTILFFYNYIAHTHTLTHNLTVLLIRAEKNIYERRSERNKTKIYLLLLEISEPAHFIYKIVKSNTRQNQPYDTSS